MILANEVNLEGKAALVTGASSGIGRAIALALGNAGVKVAICARRRQRLEEVAKTIERLERETGKHIEVTLIGHSMGTIVANWIIADYGAQLQPSNIVYLAAASPISDFERQVIPYLASAEGEHTQFYNLTLHRLAEVRERNVHILPYVDLAPRGSLLVWIDNYLSNPESFLDRTLGRWDNVIVATHIFPKNTRDRVHIKAFGIRPWGEKNSVLNPEKHGEFTDGAFWRQDFWEPEDDRRPNKCKPPIGTAKRYSSPWHTE